MARILVVDDDVELVESVREILQTAGHTVLTATNGEEGCRQAIAAKPDLMLLDVMMATDTEGFDVARKLKSNEATRNLPVILVTGIRKAKRLPFGFEPDEDWLPVQQVLEKPVKPEDLLRSVALALAPQAA
jgi:two-component system, OmpR family, alkaline phosphatase synthesis response regulator PhoP